MVFHGVRDAPELKLEIHREGPDFNTAFDAFDKAVMREKFWPAVVRCLAAVSLSLQDRSDSRVSKVTEGMYILHSDSGKPTYSFTFSAGNLRMSIGTMLDDVAESRIHHYAERLRNDQNIDKVLDLFVQSLVIGKDDFRAFLAVWTALEIFVTSNFKRTYEQCWFDRLQGMSPPSAKPYFKAVKAAMSDRHRLLDKFVVIASLLDPESGTDAITQFKSIKQIRDNVFHGSDDPNAGHPTDQAQQLLMKYLRLHFDREG